MQPRKIEIYSIKLNKIDQKENVINFTVECSKGTYIRSLCEDIATKMGTVGYMKELNRTKVGIFDIKDSITIEELENNIGSEDLLQKSVISIEQLFVKLYGEKNKIILNEKKLTLFFNGVKLSYSLQDGMYRIYDENSRFIGIGSVEQQLLKREII